MNTIHKRIDLVTEKDKKVEMAMKQEGKTKRYNLFLPMSLFDQVQVLADKENTSVLELLKRFIKIGLAITTLSQSPDVRLIIREGDRERELLLL